MAHHYLLCVGSLAKGSNFDNSMITREVPYWGLSKRLSNDAINAAIAKGEDVAIWLRGTKPSCMAKYGNERLLGVFIVKSITKRQLGPLIALEPDDKELGWTSGGWEYVINYSKYYDISALDFGGPACFGLRNHGMSPFTQPKNYFRKGVDLFDTLLPLLPSLGCVKKY
jgi:hypothetical protein